jgi:hypothetical protein
MKFFRNYHVLMNAEGDSGTGGGGASGDGGTGGQSQQTNQSNSGGKSGSGSIDELPEWAKNEIKSLRGESAKHRTTNNELKSKLDGFEQILKKAGLVNDEIVDPEKALSSVTAQAEALAINNALMEIALDNGLPKEQFKYFSFLMNEKLAELEEGQEMTEEDLAEILEQVGTGHTTQKANSSFAGQGKERKTGGDEVTLEAFSKMTIMQKSALYQKDQATYNRLMGEARGKGLL